MSDKYARVRKFFSEHPWCILPSTLDTMIEIMELRVEGKVFTDEEIQARIGAAGPPRREARAVGTVAVIPLHGVIAPRMNAMTQISGGTSTDAFGSAFSRLVDSPEVGAIVVDGDSPGGSVFGIEELASTIRGARGTKPIVAVANHRLASAAYWLASQCDELIVSPSSQVGSIGALAVHQDLSAAAEKAGVKTTVVSAGKFKSEGNSMAPLSDEARAHMQSLVDGYYDTFVKAVARGRRTTPQAVREGFGEGRMVQAREAVKLGMADAIGTLDQVIERLAGGSRSVAGAAAQGGESTFVLKSLIVNAAAEAVEPDEHGNCPEGYEKGDDGMCHPMSEEAKAAKEANAALRQRLAALGA